jgi:CRISPR-associated protein Csd2
VTDVCLKRKIRNFVQLVKAEEKGYDIYVKEKAILNHLHDNAYKERGLNTEGTKEGQRKGKGDQVEKARQWMCEHYFDVRTFGAVMSTGTNCGQVRGPLQLTFGRSVAPVLPLEHSITRMAVTTDKEAEAQQGDNRTMGRKHTLPYGLYLARGFISPHLARATGFGEADLALLWQALAQMFEHDRSASRGFMATRGLYVFEHESPLGNAPAHELLERIQVQELQKPARRFSDFRVAVNEANLPHGVTLHRMVEAKTPFAQAA